MTKHTPGPWRIELSQFNSPHVVAFHARAAEVAHATGDIVLATPAPHFDKAEREANARLIAAAPDLLEALNGLLGYTGGWDLTDPTHPIVQARAAITKATGDA